MLSTWTTASTTDFTMHVNIEVAGEEKASTDFVVTIEITVDPCTSVTLTIAHIEDFDLLIDAGTLTTHQVSVTDDSDP